MTAYRKPETYWEERIDATEGALIELLKIVGGSLPHMQPQINTLMRNWDKILGDIDREYK